MRILPHIGLDELRFGASRDEVRTYLGEPEQIHAYDLGSEELTEAWYYWEAGISCHFDAEVDWRLETIEISALPAELNGSRLIGNSEAHLRSTLASVDAKWPNAELEPVEVPAWSMIFWIEGGLVESVQWSVALGDDDAELWPSRVSA